MGAVLCQRELNLSTDRPGTLRQVARGGLENQVS